MLPKFDMQHDQTAGLQNGKVPPSPEPKMVASCVAKTVKSAFSPEPLNMFG